MSYGIQERRADDRRIILNDNVVEWGEVDWSILEDRRGILPEFPTGALSEALRDYIGRAAGGAGVTFGHVAVPLISIASGLDRNRPAYSARAGLDRTACSLGGIGRFLRYG